MPDPTYTVFKAARLGPLTIAALTPTSAIVQLFVADGSSLLGSFTITKANWDDFSSAVDAAFPVA